MAKIYILTLANIVVLVVMMLLIYRFWYEGMPADEVMKYLPYLIIFYFISGMISSTIMLMSGRRR